MGKFIRKSKLTDDVAVMDVSQSALGVRTRAKTLALQRLQSASAADPPPPKPDSCYLELRSRRLEKPPLLRPNYKKNTTARKQGLTGRVKEAGISPGKPRSDSALSIGLTNEEDGCMERQSRDSVMEDSEIEASFGENVLDSEPRGSRSTRESTPCSLIKAADTITPPGSSTKRAMSSYADQSARSTVLRNVPTARELEEFFSEAEKLQQRRFIEKYNFDIVNDAPLPGRYEWVKVMP